MLQRLGRRCRAAPADVVDSLAVAAEVAGCAVASKVAATRVAAAAWAVVGRVAVTPAVVEVAAAGACQEAAGMVVEALEQAETEVHRAAVDEVAGQTVAPWV